MDYMGLHPLNDPENPRNVYKGKKAYLIGVVDIMLSEL